MKAVQPTQTRTYRKYMIGYVGRWWT